MYQFIITEYDVVIYESDELYDSYEAAEEMALQWCSDYAQGGDLDYSDLEYDIEEV